MEDPRNFAAALAAAPSAVAVRDLLHRTIEAARMAGRLPALHLAAREALRDGAAGRWTPYALVAAAVALLRQGDRWLPGGDKPGPDLLAALDDLIAEAAALPEERRIYLGMLEGVRHYVAGDIEAAFDRFAAVGAGPTPSPWFDGFDFASPARFVRPLPARFPAGVADRLLPAGITVIGDLPALLPPLMASVSVDARYAQAFGGGLVQSFARAEKFGLHLHLVAQRNAAQKLAAAFAGQAAEAGTSLVVTQADPVSTDPAYFACSRFLAASACLDVFKRPLLILDADCKAAPTPAAASSLLEAAAADRVLARRMPPTVAGYLPWRRIWAGLVFVPQGPRGRAFASAVADAIGWFWRSDGTRLWWIDQLALEAARIMLEREAGKAAGPGPVPHAIGSAFVAMTPAEKNARLGSLPRTAPVGARPTCDLPVARVACATLIPPRHRDGEGVPFRMAVYDAGGQPVPEGDFLRRGWRMGGAERSPPSRRLEGPHAYGGVLFRHFGHFLIETLSRAWFLRSQPGLPVLWHQHDRPIGAPHREILALLGIGCRADLILHEAASVAELVVPAPGAVMGRSFHPAQARALGVVPFGPVRRGRRVWLSRKELPAQLARIEGEGEVEERLRGAGWQIVALEALPLRDQLAALAGAERIAGFMGSAFHLLLLFDEVPARVTIFDRLLQRDLVRTYSAIAEAKGLEQEILPLAMEWLGPPGPRTSLRLKDPAGAAALLEKRV